MPAQKHHDEPTQQKESKTTVVLKPPLRSLCQVPCQALGCPSTWYGAHEGDARVAAPLVRREGHVYGVLCVTRVRTLRVLPGHVCERLHCSATPYPCKRVMLGYHNSDESPLGVIFFDNGLRVDFGVETTVDSKEFIVSTQSRHLHLRAPGPKVSVRQLPPCLPLCTVALLLTHTASPEQVAAEFVAALQTHRGIPWVQSQPHDSFAPERWNNKYAMRVIPPLDRLLASYPPSTTERGGLQMGGKPMQPLPMQLKAPQPRSSSRASTRTAYVALCHLHAKLSCKGI